MITATTFSWVAGLVYAEAAIVLETGKEYLVESRLMPLARAARSGDVDAWVTKVRRNPSAADRDAIVEAIVTSETSWFRDRTPFEVFVERVLPSVMNRPGADGIVRVWSAACSSGQEAYTLAILLAEHLPAGWRGEILASDISKQMTSRVADARYSQLEIGRGLPAAHLVKHFVRVGTHWQVSDELRSLVRVRQINLAKPFPVLPTFDVVFLRNVLLYFDQTTKRQILTQVRQTTRPGGYLFLGASETTAGLDDTWERERLDRFTLIRHPELAGPAAADPRVASLAGNG